MIELAIFDGIIAPGDPFQLPPFPLGVQSLVTRLREAQLCIDEKAVSTKHSLGG